MRARQRLLVPLAAGLVAGCQSPGAVFVTKSSLAIADIDATPAEMTIAMHRVEGFIAPRNQNGNTPPVLAHIRSNRDFIYPEVRQVYATGTAAERIAGDYVSNNSECTNCAPGTSTSPVVFTTSTTVGLRLGLTTENLVDGLVLGYRRKEMSFVPSLAVDRAGTYRYPSLIAAIHLNGSKDATRTGGFQACQGFATGTAATRLAESDDSGLGCLGATESIKGLLASKNTAELRQQAEIARVLSCYVHLPDERRRGVHENAVTLGLLPRAEGGMVRAGGQVVEVKTARTSEDNRYAMHLLGAVVPSGAEDGERSGKSPAFVREQMLRAHREAVCAAVPDPAPPMQVDD